MAVEIWFQGGARAGTSQRFDDDVEMIRIGRNPKPGEEVPILPRQVLVFRPSHVLKNRINESLHGSI